MRCLPICSAWGGCNAHIGANHSSLSAFLNLALQHPLSVCRTAPVTAASAYRRAATTSAPTPSRRPAWETVTAQKYQTLSRTKGEPFWLSPVTLNDLCSTVRHRSRSVNDTYPPPSTRLPPPLCCHCDREDYATIDNVDPKDDLFEDASCTKEPLPVPAGWRLADWDSEIAKVSAPPPETGAAR